MRIFHPQNPVRERIPGCCPEHPIEVLMRKIQQGQSSGGEKNPEILALCLEFYQFWVFELELLWQGLSAAAPVPALHNSGSQNLKFGFWLPREFLCKEIFLLEVSVVLIFNSSWFSLRRSRRTRGGIWRKAVPTLPKTGQGCSGEKSEFSAPLLLQLGNSKDKSRRFQSPALQSSLLPLSILGGSPSSLLPKSLCWDEPCTASVWCQTLDLFPLFGAGSFLGKREAIIALVPLMIS